MVVDSVNTLRSSGDFTIKEMAARLAHYGWPVSVATLTGILSGRKRGSFTIAEVMAFARALNVSPLYLILGLPKHANLPAGPLFGDERDIGSVAAWFEGGYTMKGHPDDDLVRENQSPQWFVEAIARQGLRDVLDHAHMLRMIRWQAAQLVAARDFQADDVARVLPAAVLDQTYFWDAVNRLSAARAMQRRLDPNWSISLPPLPNWLQFVDVEPSQQVEDPMNTDLRTLTSEDLIEQARQRIRDLIAEAPPSDLGRRDIGND